ncbi:hypothetical protein Golomagni_02500 [Golovinomyces magnicellulatus]|nr:hypothetical protein Golomagni_02500 [Golovinomyces magnicellulatus]
MCIVSIEGFVDFLVTGHFPSAITCAMADVTISTLATSYQPSNSSSSRARSRQRRRQDLIRYASFFSAIFSCLCAGTISCFSLYGHLFLERLKYTQTQVNIVALAGQISISLPFSLIGYLCDRTGPAFVSFLSAIFFGLGYTLAAFTYKIGASTVHRHTDSQVQSVWVMVIAFIFIGIATTFMYLSSLTTCAKNFQKAKYRGFALSSPIAAYGLSGLWQSQIGSRLFYERSPEGGKGDVDVFKFFIFLACILLVAGLTGSILLKIVDEDDLIEEAVERLERSGLLENNESPRDGLDNYSANSNAINYEGIEVRRELSLKRGATFTKGNILNKEAAAFFKDPTMWWFAAGFFLVSGPGDAFITNLGTVIGTLYPSYIDPSSSPTTAATHVSIVSITSTTARILFGTLTDIFTPTPGLKSGVQKFSASSSIHPRFSLSKFYISRMTFLLISALLLSAGQVFLAVGFVQNHAERFWIVSGLIGFGYGAIFTLSPLIVSIVWGVENFGTNWGLIAMTTAVSATAWDLIYSKVYETGAKAPSNFTDGEEDLICHGKACYMTTFWAMSWTVWIGCALWLWAWKGTRGWTSRGVSL